MQQYGIVLDMRLKHYLNKRAMESTAWSLGEQIAADSYFYSLSTALQVEHHSSGKRGGVKTM